MEKFVFLLALLVPTWAFYVPEKDIDAAEVRIMRKRNTQDEGYQLELKVLDEVYDLQLLPAGGVFSPNFRMYVIDDEFVPRQITLDPEIFNRINNQLYTDNDNTASLLVETRNGQLTVEGILNDNLRIVPQIEINERTRDVEIRHVAYKIQRKSGNSYSKVLDIPNNWTSVPTPVPDVSLKATIPNPVQVELLEVLDSIMTRAYTKSDGSVDNERLLKYLGVFYSSNNRRFATIKTHNMKFLISQVVTTPSSANEPYMVRKGTNQIEGGESLNKFGQWLLQNKAKFQRYDTAMAHTAHDMVDCDSGSTCSSGLAGIAYLAQACRTYSDVEGRVAFGEDVPDSYVGVHTIAHELAHSCGAPHDGDSASTPSGNPGAQNCPWSDGYMMSYELGKSNRMVFSKCTADSIYYTLNQRGYECMLDSPARSVATVDNQPLPGTLKTPNQQCEAYFGSGYVASQPNTADMCKILWCNRQGSSSATAKGTAYEGTTCGTNKWCINGVCVSK